MTNKQAQELLIQNGQLVADTLRHLADNEIDSDYFAITSTNENGTETECELVITAYARQAAGTVDELIKALEAKDNRIAELESREVTLPPTFWYEHDDLSREVPVLDKRLVKKAIRAAGICINGED